VSWSNENQGVGFPCLWKAFQRVAESAKRGAAKRAHRGSKRLADEAGQAMMVVLGVILLMTIVTASLAATTVQHDSLSVDLANGSSAIAAAEAGLANYEGHLQADSEYPAAYNQANSYAGSTNPAFSKWVEVKGSPTEYFTYRVVPAPGDASGKAAPSYYIVVAGCSGVLSTSSTGQSSSSCTGSKAHPGNQFDLLTRKVTLSSPFYNAYFTKYEMYDPMDPNYYPGGNLPNSSQVSQVTSECSVLASQKNLHGSFPAPVDATGGAGTVSFEGGYGPDLAASNIDDTGVGCKTAMWQSQVVQGPVTTMDNLYICGNPKFEGQVSAYKENPFWVSLNNTVYWLWVKTNEACDNSPSFGGDGHIKSVSYEHLPRLSVFQEEAEVQPTGSSKSFGCYYQGQTTIEFDGNKAQVSSPNSVIGTSPGQLNSGCPIGENKHFGSGFNGVIYVGPSSGDTPSVGPPPPETACSKWPWGPPVFELGYNPRGGNGFSGCWEPQQPGYSTPQNSPTGWLLHWETNDSPNKGDLFLQGTVGMNATIVANNNLYLAGSVCVPSDATCQETNDTGVVGDGNGANLDTSYTEAKVSSLIPPKGPMVGVIAGSLIKAYNPTQNPSIDHPLKWSFSFHDTLKVNVGDCLSFQSGCLRGGVWFQVNMNFHGNGLDHEGSLEGYPHQNVIVDGVVYDLGGGTTMQDMADAGQAGISAAAMDQPNPFCHVEYLRRISAFFGTCGSEGAVSANIPLGNFDVNGAIVEEYAPNLSCNQVSFPIIGKVGLCSTYTDLEIPYPRFRWGIPVLDIGNGSCPVPTDPPAPQSSGSWGPVDVLSSHRFRAFHFTYFAYCLYADAYQVPLSKKMGYAANFTYNSSLAAALPPFFPEPRIQQDTTVGLAPSGSIPTTGKKNYAVSGLFEEKNVNLVTGS